MSSSKRRPNDRISLPEISSKYLNSLILVESFSSQTIRAYASDLEQAFDLRKYGRLTYSDESDPPCQFVREGDALLPAFQPEGLLRASRDALSRWGNLAPASRNRKSATLKSFLNWLFKEGWIDSDLGVQIVSPKVPVRLPHFLSLDEALALLKNLGAWIDQSPPEERRERTSVKALVLLLYGGGLRVSEACALKWADVRAKDGILRILGKGGKERFVAVPSAVILALRALPSDGPYVFGQRTLDTRKAYGWVRAAGVRADLLKPLHPHALRHSFATHLLASGANLRSLQELLGHSTLQATQKYTHVSIDQLARTLERHHPLAEGGSKPLSTKRKRV